MKRNTTRKTYLFQVTAFAFLICLLSWPAIVNGSAIFFYDSLSYLGSAATAFREVFGLETIWAHASGEPAMRADPVQTQIPKATADQNVRTGHPDTTQKYTKNKGTNSVIVAGRSIYYGIFLLSSYIVGSLWLSVAVQSFIVVLAIYMTFRVVLPDPSLATFLSLLILGIFSSLPFFTSYLMPDFLTGIVILAVANVAAFGARMQRWMVSAWGVLLLFGLVSHSSHILVASAMIVGWGLVQVITRRTLFTAPLVLLVGMVGAAAAAEVAFFKITESLYGAAPVRPPFLMARTISDGPGYAYLIENCGRHDLRICDFVAVLPQPTDDILWSKNPQTGVYGISDGVIRRELADQQMEFVLSVLRYDPFGQIGASFQGLIQQLFMIELDEFAYTHSLKTNLENNLPVEQKNIVENTLLYRGMFPLDQATFVTTAAVILSLLYIFCLPIFLKFNKKIYNCTINRNVKNEFDSRYFTYFDYYKKNIWVFGALVLAGLCFNAAATGILSTPHDRYQARVIWLVPFLGMYLICLRNTYLTRISHQGWCIGPGNLRVLL